MISPRLIAYIVAIGAILGAIYWFNGVLDERTELRETVKQDKISIAIKDSQIADSIEQTKQTAEFMKVQEVQNAKDKELRDCVAAGKCGVIVRGSSCPKTTNDNTARSEPEAPRLDEDLERHILYLKESIEYNASIMRAKDDFIQKCGMKLEKAK